MNPFQMTVMIHLVYPRHSFGREILRNEVFFDSDFHSIAFNTRASSFSRMYWISEHFIHGFPFSVKVD